MVGCMTLCGVGSSAPRAPLKWAGPTPAPTEARQQRGEEKLVVDMAFALEVAVAGT
jgi:hypothetical protein